MSVFGNVGLGHRKIVMVLDLSRDKVRNYCKANGLDGYAKKRLQAKEGERMEEECADSVCRHCGKTIDKQTTGRKRIYCLEECRRAWSKNHLPLYKHECMFCGQINLKVHPRRKNSVAMTVISGTGLEKREYRRNCENASLREKSSYGTQMD